MKRLILRFLTNQFFPIAWLWILPFIVYSQQVQPDTCQQKDLPDLIREAKGKPLKQKKEGAGSLLLFPIIGSNPAIGFMVGVGGQYAFKMPGQNTLYSIVSGSAQYTTKNQFLFLLKNSIYSNDNRIFFTGDWRYQIFSQPTYGLGTNAPEGGILDYQFSLGGEDVANDSLAQPMNFNFARLYQSASIKLMESLYLGIGYNFDSYTNIRDQRLRLTPGDSLITSHYAYNTYYGFSTSSYYSSAFAINFIYDTRDNMINPYKGYYVMVNWRSARKFLGNENNANYFNFEYRSFHRVSDKNPRHLIAFWVLGYYSPDGQFPYMILPATSYDQRSRSGRGYAQGRFRGNDFLYGETEYRFPISKCSGVLGGVVFLNATTAANPITSHKLFDSVKPGYGVGLRVMVDKHSRTNLALDFGFGDKSSGFYLAASETF